MRVRSPLPSTGGSRTGRLVNVTSWGGGLDEWGPVVRLPSVFARQVPDVSRDFTSIAATEALPAFGVLLAVVAVAAWLLGRRRQADLGAVEWFVGLATLALIVAVTTFRGEVSFGFRPSRLVDWVFDFDALSRDPLGSSQFMLNIALFVPAGMAWGWLTRRPLRALGILAGFSFLIECIQGVTGVGANDIVDLLSNISGAAIGTGVSAVVLQVRSRRASTPLSSRTRTVVVASAAVMCALVAIGWFSGASARQTDVENSLRRAFEGTDLQAIEKRLDEDAMAVLRIDDVLSDGAIFLDGSTTYRYPATFFSLHRCVYVTWIADGVDFRKAAGSACTDFIDRSER